MSMSLTAESIRIMKMKWRQGTNKRKNKTKSDAYQKDLKNFHKDPSEVNAYALCRHYPKTITNIVNPTDKVKSYNKLYWA
jgi:hypothetical protein